MKKATKIAKTKKFKANKKTAAAGLLGAVLLTSASVVPAAAAGLTWNASNGYLINATGSNTTSTTSASASAGTTASTASDLKVTNMTVSDLVALKTKDYATAWSAGTYTAIKLNSTSATVSGSGAKASGSTVTISEAGTYVVSGKLTDGQIVIAAADTDDVHVVFKGVTLANDSTSPFYVKSAGKVVVTLSAGTTNTITDSSTYTFAEGEDEPDAAMLSKANLTINGTGILSVTGNYKDGIRSKDNLNIVSGKITVKAVEDAIIGKDRVVIEGGTFNIDAGFDGIKSTNDTNTAKGFVAISGGTFNITAGNDGIQAETALVIDGGDFDIVTGGGYENGRTHTDDFGGGFGGQMPEDWTPGEMPTNADGTTMTPPTNADGTAMTPPANLNTAPGTEADETTEEAETTESMKALKAGTELVINDGTFTIDAADDAVHSNGNVNIAGGTFDVATGDDGFHADAVLEISAGTIEVTNSYESLEGFIINIKGGDIDVTASDDGVNAAGDDPTLAATTDTATPGNGMMEASNAELNISGGTLTVNAGGDGLDSNGSVNMTGGTVIVNGPTDNGNGPLDYDGTFEIGGGTLIAAGSSGMAQAPSTSSSQRSLGITFAASLSAGTLVHVEDSAGNNVLTFAPAKSFSSVVVSSSALKAGETYTVSTGGTSTGTEFDGLYTGGTYSGGTTYTTFEFSTSDATTWVDESGVNTGPSSMGGFGGGGMGGDGTTRGPRGTQSSSTSTTTSATTAE